MTATHPTASLWTLLSHPVPCLAYELARKRDPDVVVRTLRPSSWRPGLLRCDNCGRHFDWVFERAYTAPGPRP